jgi:hypothetical protein
MEGTERGKNPPLLILSILFILSKELRVPPFLRGDSDR